MTPRSSIGSERDDHQTGWLLIAWILWFSLAWSTVLVARIYAQLEEDSFSGRPIFIVFMVVLGIVFAFFSYRVSKRVSRGPQRKLSKPYLRYLANLLLAMILAWFLNVFGGVCAMFGIPFWAVLVVFFVPAWLLFLINVPTRAKLSAWANGGGGPASTDPS